MDATERRKYQGRDGGRMLTSTKQEEWSHSHAG